VTDFLGPYQLGPNDTAENGIYTGDARELARWIPDESIDLIFTDPVYDQIEDYRWLAEMAAVALQPDRSCLSWIATPLLSQILRVMEPPLRYAWMMNLQKYGPCYPGKPGICIITQCLWMEKGNSKTYSKIADWFGGKNTGKLPEMRNQHHWSKPQNVYAKWLTAFAKDEFIIFDPFTGGGTVPAVCKMLGRRYLAFEINPETADLARERVRNTQPPLFVLGHEQLDLELS